MYWLSTLMVVYFNHPFSTFEAHWRDHVSLYRWEGLVFAFQLTNIESSIPFESLVGTKLYINEEATSSFHQHCTWSICTLPHMTVNIHYRNKRYNPTSAKLLNHFVGAWWKHCRTAHGQGCVQQSWVTSQIDQLFDEHWACRHGWIDTHSHLPPPNFFSTHQHLDMLYAC